MTTVSKRQSDHAMRSVGYVILIALILCIPAGENPTFADSYFFEEVDKGLLSIGGRATYIDPLDASPKWYGGAQVRLHLGQIFAIEGSVDYREKKFDNTFTRTYSGPSVGIGLPSSRCWTYPRNQNQVHCKPTPRVLSLLINRICPLGSRP